MNDVSTDHGMVLERGSWAIVLTPDNKLQLATPKLPPGSLVSDGALILTAAFVRLDNDPDFRQECLNWFKEQGRG